MDLVECGTHAFAAAEAGSWSVGEKTLAATWYPRPIGATPLSS
jgi:hypothetical protein